MGVRAYQQRSFEEAAECFGKVAEILPDQVAPWSNLGNALLELSDFDGACKAYGRAISIDQESAEAHYNLGAALRRAGHPREAVLAYQEAMRCGMRSHEVLNNLGIALKDDGRLEEAATCYREALAMAPESAALHLNLANALGDQGRLDQAIVHYRSALSLDASSAEANLGLFAALYDERDPKAGVACLRDAIAARPGYEPARFQLAAIHAFIGDRDRAAPLLEGLPAHLRSSIDFVTRHRAAMFSDGFRLIDYALSLADVDGVVIELGVRHGTSIRHIAERVGESMQVFGFDSFQGLPEAWGGLPRGAYSTDGKLPEVPANVELRAGWFEDTLPAFAAREARPIRFMNVDCDLYSSTASAFTALGPKLVPGSVVVFDEYLANPGWETEEHRAWLEAVETFGIAFDYVAFSLFSRQAVVKVTGVAPQTPAAV